MDKITKIYTFYSHLALDYDTSDYFYEIIWARIQFDRLNKFLLSIEHKENRQEKFERGMDVDFYRRVEIT